MQSAVEYYNKSSLFSPKVFNLMMLANFDKQYKLRTPCALPSSLSFLLIATLFSQLPHSKTLDFSVKACV